MNKDRVATSDDNCLDALFEKARNHPPSDAELGAMLRAVPEKRTSRWALAARRIGAALAVAAAIAVAVLLIAPPDQPKAFALSDVVAAMRKVRVVKSVDENGDTHWSAEGGMLADVAGNGTSCMIRDLSTGECVTYKAARGSIIWSTVDPLYRQFRGVMDAGARNTLEGLVQQAEMFGRSFEKEWEQTGVTVDGRPFIVLKRKEGRYGPILEYGIDPTTGLLAWSKGFIRGHVTFEYPDQFPRDIHELGAPVDAEVLDWRASGDILALRDHVFAAKEQSFGTYRMVVANTSGQQVIFVITDGERVRVDRIPADLPSSLTVAELEEAAAGYLDHVPTDRKDMWILFDGRTETEVWPVLGGPAQKTVCAKELSHNWPYTLRGKVWESELGRFFGSDDDARLEYIGPDDKGWIGFRCYEQGNHRQRPNIQERWFDPAHGYALGGRASFDLPGADWQLDPFWAEEYLKYDVGGCQRALPDAPASGGDAVVLKWAELREGQWYPRIWMWRRLMLAEDGTWQVGAADPMAMGYVDRGHVVRYETPRPSQNPRPPIGYTCILAEPLDSVDDAWFEMPPEWESLPTGGF